MTIFVKSGHFWQRTSNLNAFEMQYLSNVIYFLFLLLETDILSYLPPFYHNFENLTLYGIYEFLRGRRLGQIWTKSPKNLNFFYLSLTSYYKLFGKLIGKGRGSWCTKYWYTKYYNNNKVCILIVSFYFLEFIHILYLKN